MLVYQRVFVCPGDLFLCEDSIRDKIGRGMLQQHQNGTMTSLILLEVWAVAGQGSGQRRLRFLLLNSDHCCFQPRRLTLHGKDMEICGLLGGKDLDARDKQINPQ